MLCLRMLYVPAKMTLLTRAVSSHLELLCLLNLAQLGEREIERLHDLVNQTENWDLFFDLVDLNSTGILVSERLSLLIEGPQSKNRLCSVFKNRFEELQSRIKPWKTRSELLLKAIPDVLQAMAQANIQVIVLKGGLFAHTLYDVSAYKRMNDLDFLIPYSQAEQATRVLKKLGYSPLGMTDGRPEISPSTHHTPPYISSDSARVIGLHWGLHPPRSKWTSDIEGIWKRKTPFHARWPNSWQMSCEDTLLHLCIHLPYYKIGLRELADLFNFALFSSPPLDWELFAQRCQEWNASDPVFRALTLANSLVPIPVPKNALATWRKEALSSTLKDTEARTASLQILLNSRSTYITKIEKNFLIFKISQNFYEQIHAWRATWRLVFFAPEEEIRRISLCTQKRGSPNYFSCQLKTPFLILRAMSRDHGGRTILRITLMNLFIVFRNTLTLRFLQHKPTLLNTLTGAKGSLSNLAEMLE